MMLDTTEEQEEMLQRRNSRKSEMDEDLMMDAVDGNIGDVLAESAGDSAEVRPAAGSSFVEKLIHRKNSRAASERASVVGGRDEYDNGGNDSCQNDTSSDEGDAANRMGGAGNASGVSSDEALLITPLQRDVDVTMDEFSSRRPLLSPSHPQGAEGQHEEEVVEETNCFLKDKVDDDGAEKENKIHISNTGGDTTENMMMSTMDISATDFCNESTITSLVTVPLSTSTKVEQQGAGEQLTIPYKMNRQASHPPRRQHFFRRTNPSLSRTKSSRSVGSTTGGILAAAAAASASSPASSTASTSRASMALRAIKAGAAVAASKAGGSGGGSATGGRARPHPQPPTSSITSDGGHKLVSNSQSQSMGTGGAGCSPGRSPLRRAAMSCWTPRGTAAQFDDVQSEVQSYHYDPGNAFATVAAASAAAAASTNPRNPSFLNPQQSPRRPRANTSSSGFVADSIDNSNPGIVTVSRRQRDGLFKSLSWDPVVTTSATTNTIVSAAGGKQVRPTSFVVRPRPLFASGAGVATASGAPSPRIGGHGRSKGQQTRQGHQHQQQQSLLPGLSLARSASSEYISGSPARAAASNACAAASSGAGGGVGTAGTMAERWHAHFHCGGPTGIGLGGRNTMLLQSPMRMDVDKEDAIATRCYLDMEREDALDILSCLVERSVAFQAEVETQSRASAAGKVRAVECGGDSNDDDNDNDRGEEVEVGMTTAKNLDHNKKENERGFGGVGGGFEDDVNGIGYDVAGPAAQTRPRSEDSKSAEGLLREAAGVTDVHDKTAQTENKTKDEVALDEAVVRAQTNPNTQEISFTAADSPLPPPALSLALRRTSSSASEISAVADTLREISRKFDDEEAQRRGTSSSPSSSDPRQRPGHERRMSVLDELLRSHTYAVEMKRASMSAHSWLKSIGRDPARNFSSGSGTGGTSASAVKDENVGPAMQSWSLSNNKNGWQRRRRRDEVILEEECKVADDGIYDEDHEGQRIGKSPHTTTGVENLEEEYEGRLRDKEMQIMMLDQELCKCRAEIGRLKSAARAEALFTSPNRSIFDDDPDFDVASSVGDGCNGENVSVLENALGDITPVPEHEDDDDDDDDADDLDSGEGNGGTDADDEEEGERNRRERNGNRAAGRKMLARNIMSSSSSCSFSSLDEMPLNERISEEDEDDHDKSGDRGGVGRKLKKEIARLRNELRSANGKIQALHASNDAKREDEPGDDEDPQSKKYTPPPQSQIGRLGDENGRSNGDRDDNDEKLINVRMLDAENFVTDWDDLAPLPPPPDHGLRAPIVHALLAQWTPDESMHESLLRWMECVMEGTADVSDVPPLTLTSLDHQIRDGFAMHVLPLLLRRSDVHVEVTTRAHRRTTYDIAVSVAHTGTTVGSAEMAAHNCRPPGCDDPGRTLVSVGLSQHASSRRDNVHAGSNDGANSKHMMAFNASSGNSIAHEREDDDCKDNEEQQPLAQQSDAEKMGKRQHHNLTGFWKRNGGSTAGGGGNMCHTASNYSDGGGAIGGSGGPGSAANSSTTVPMSNLPAPGDTLEEPLKVPQDIRGSTAMITNAGGGMGITGSPSFEMRHASGFSPYEGQQVQDHHQNHHWSSGGTRSIDEVSIGSSITGASSLRTPSRNTEERSVFMKAFGGAIGGFLSRRGGGSSTASSRASIASSTPRHSWSYDDGDMESWNDSPPRHRGGTGCNSRSGYQQHVRYPQSHLPTIPSSPNGSNASNNNKSHHHHVEQQPRDEEQQPYHRVVSAPPGRIGIQFVQFRGNAMVSDVSPDSPLRGWVFPSDILIAIDEVPVSGAPVREIVKILTARKGRRQRSLRVISSHAMTELTQTAG